MASSRNLHPAAPVITVVFRLLAVALLGGIALTVSPGGPAAAGGWALGSLDSLPTPTAGEPTDVGFTILQHGVTPAELDSDVGIELVVDGSIEFFAAQPDGAPGHYVATVMFPESGSYQWNIRMGWFGPQDLGTISVSEASPDSTAVWPTVRWVMLAVTLLLAAIAVTDLVRNRRRDIVVA